MLFSDEIAVRPMDQIQRMDRLKYEYQNEKHMKNILNASIATLQRKLCQLQRELHYLEEENSLQEQAFSVIFEDDGFSPTGPTLREISETAQSDKY